MRRSGRLILKEFLLLQNQARCTLCIVFLAGLLGSRGMVFVRYAPFGAAAVAAVPIRSIMGCDCRQFGWLHMAVNAFTSNSIHSGDYCNCYYSLVF